MQFWFTPYATALLVTAPLDLFVAYLVWQKRDRPGGRLLFYLLLALTWWTLTTGLEAAALGIPHKVLWAQIGYIGIEITPVLALLFVMAYTYYDRWLQPWMMRALFIIPFMTILMAWTNKWHALLWTSFTMSSAETNLLLYGHGPWYNIRLVYIYTLAVVMVALLIRTVFRVRRIYRRQIIPLLLACVVIPAGNLVYVFDLGPIRGLDMTPFTFTIFCMLLTFSIYRLRMMDLTPVSRDRVVESIPNGLLVADAAGQIVDINAWMMNLLNRLHGESRCLDVDDLIGDQLSANLLGSADLAAVFTSDREERHEVSLILDGAENYFQLHLIPLFDSRERLTGRMGILTDISAHKRLSLFEARARSTSESLRKIALGLSATLNLGQVNERIIAEVCNLIECDHAGLLLWKDGEWVMADRPVAGREAEPDALSGSSYEKIMTARQVVRLDDFVLLAPLFLGDKDIGILRLERSPAHPFNVDDEQTVVLFTAQASIALENARLFEQVRKMAITDGLTGLNNRHHFIELAEAEFRRVQRYKRPLTALMIDLDHFKRINDAHGHQAGDAVLTAVAHTCRAMLRDADIIGRYGGEEFAIVMPETILQDAREAAERLRLAVAEIVLPVGDGIEISLTTSLGVAVNTGNIKTLAELLECADQALYTAKRAGRDQVVVYTPEK